MSDDLERRLRSGLSLDRLPTAPEELRMRLEQLADREPTPRRSPFVIIATMFAIALVGIALTGILWIGGLTSPLPTPTPSASPTPAAPTATPVPTVAAPASVEGIPVMTVSELLAARAAGGLVDQPVALKGYWTNREVASTCVPTTEKVGDLEIRCSDGEYGITERFEAIGDLTSDSRWIPASGPHLTPWVPDSVAAQLFAGSEPAFFLPPVPIVVIGHFDDPRAADCNKAKRQLCRDRLVLDRVVTFDPASAPAVTPSPSPTPFPNPPPADLFSTQMCYDSAPKAFIGWTTTDKLPGGFERQGHVFAMVTQDVVAFGDWFDSPQYKGHQARWWGQGVCIAQTPGTIEFSAVAGSTFLEIDDGRHIEGPAP